MDRSTLSNEETTISILAFIVDLAWVVVSFSTLQFSLPIDDLVSIVGSLKDLIKCRSVDW